MGCWRLYLLTHTRPFRLRDGLARLPLVTDRYGSSSERARVLADARGTGRGPPGHGEASARWPETFAWRD